MMGLEWTTQITSVTANQLLIRGYPVEELIGSIPFSSVVFLLLSGRLPEGREARVIDAVLVSSVDHGPTPPSALAARTVASTGSSLSAAVAAGILSINQYHGGAIEGCMSLLRDAMALRDSGDAELPANNWSEVANRLVADARVAGRRLPGFGHRLHTADPRTRRLFEVAKCLGRPTPAIGLARAIESELSNQLARPMPLNVDGAIGAILLELGLAPSSGNAFFMISRVPGLVAHVLEEQQGERPMRRIHPTSHTYIGPERRQVAPPEA